MGSDNFLFSSGFGDADAFLGSSGLDSALAVKPS